MKLAGTDLLVSPSCPDKAGPKPGSELELGLDFGLSTNTDEEAESFRKLCLTGEGRGEVEYESLSLSCMSGIFCGDEGGIRNPIPRVAEEYVSEYSEPPGL